MTPERVVERAERREPRRFSGRVVATAFATFLIVGTVVFAFFSRQAQVARERIQQEQLRAGTPTASP